MKISDSFCDNAINQDPFWNHTLAECPELVSVFQTILNAGLVAMSFHEVVNLHRLVTRTNALPGLITEVGTYHGGSALVMALANHAQKRIHLFDTFSGIPEVTRDVDTVEVGQIRGSSLETVKHLLHPWVNIIDYHVGLFPETAEDTPESTQFSFVNLDMDVYESTKLGLEYFYPRIVRSGVLVCHDYSSRSCPGVRKAVDQFFLDKPETLIELWHTQIVMVKL